MTKYKGTEGGRKMTTAIKPIRPMQIEFESEHEMQQFINYATSSIKTNSPGLNRLRQLMKEHKPAEERKPK
jgi:hypothetical protein